jgi:hypothetical protein
MGSLSMANETIKNANLLFAGYVFPRPLLYDFVVVCYAVFDGFNRRSCVWIVASQVECSV